MAWSVELSEFDIIFQPRGPIQSQCLADLFNQLQPKRDFECDPWVLRVDSSSNSQGGGAGVILEGPSGLALEQSLRFAFKASNNQAEYEALLARLRLAHKVGVRKLIYWTDSKVVSKQVKHTPRENNERADQLARLASCSRKPGQLRTTLHLELPTPSVSSTECLEVSEARATWMDEIMNFITTGKEPEEALAAKKIRTQAARYSVIGNTLYRRGFSTPLLKCVDSEQAEYVLREVHEGICGFYLGGRTLAAKVLRVGYDWLTLKVDCANFVKRCIQCQKHGNIIYASAEELHSISTPWPFALWGMNILGPFPLAKRQCKFLLVAIDYFTKWIEAEPLATITANMVQKFMWRNIITRFDIPHAIITDNGLQFIDQKLNKFMEDLGIRH
ncbi:uncharacterized protein LOC109807355 [Cajanus cajan]|nr:uncharacterized protein LOC109807355 [Cajanus cajan]